MARDKKRIEVDIIANDRSTHIYNKVADNTQGMVGRINNSIVSMNKTLRNYNNAMSSFNRTTQLALAGTGYLVYRFTKDSVQQFADFEKQHSKTMGAMANNYEKTSKAQRQFFDEQAKLRQDALRLGTTGPTNRGTFYDPTQVAYAQTALVKAGIPANRILQSGMTSPILKFAGGNDLSIDDATNFAVNIAKQFNVPEQKWGDMLDRITRAADISTIDVPDVFESLKYTGGIAAGLGRDLNEVLGMIAVMGNAGLKGSMAGTGIQAFFTRMLSPIGKSEQSMKTAPTEFVQQILNAFIADVTDVSGKFKSVPEVTEKLDQVMAELNDREQAWFSHKLFGLFQMKAAYALRNTGGGDLQAVIDDISNKSAGTNDMKWNMMLDSSYGKLAALGNMWTGTKTDVGYRLAPITNAIADELFAVLANKGNYDIDFDDLRRAINESGKMIGEQYGNQLGRFVSDAGNFVMGAGRAAYANEPLVEGAAASLFKLFGGDIGGSIEEMGEAISRTNERINQLPPELQGFGTQVRNVTLALMTLASINFASRLLESVTTIWRYTVGKMITAMTMNVKASNVVLMSTGVLNKSGNPIFKETTIPGGGGKTGGGGGGSTGPVFLDRDGKPMKNVQQPTILDKHGNPVSSTPKAPTRNRVSAGFNVASWAYALGEMTGANDWALDQFGVEGEARNNVDTGRSVLNWTMMAGFADSVLLKGAGKTLLKTIGKNIVSGVSSNIAAISAEVGASAGLLAAPLAAGAFLLGSEAHRKARGNQTTSDIARAESEGRKWYWAVNENPWWNPNGLFDNRRTIITGKTKEEQAAKADKDRYRYPDMIKSAKPSFEWWENIPGFDGRRNDWLKRESEYQKQQEYTKQLYNSARFLSVKRGKGDLPYDAFAKDIGTWKNDKDITKDTGEVKSSFSALELANSIFNNIPKQQPPVVNVTPNINVNVTVDQNGNVLDKKTYIGDFNLLDKAFGVFGSRVGK